MPILRYFFIFFVFLHYAHATWARPCVQIQSQSIQSHKIPVQGMQDKIDCGEPLVEAQENQEKNSLEPLDLQLGLTQFSQKNIKNHKDSLGKLSDEENKILRKAKEYKPYISHRIPARRLRQVLTSGALWSPKETEKQLNRAVNVFTPRGEDSLFAAFDCVFATVGSPIGKESYGEILFQFKNKSAKKAWATPSSGYHFLEDKRNADLDLTQLQDIYSKEIFVGSDWPDYLGIKMIQSLRNQSLQDRTKTSLELIQAKRPDVFWEIVDVNRLAYLEAKYDSSVSLEEIETIVVPKELEAEIRTWPEAKKWMKKIRFEK